jgi:hypothetical protein
MINNINDLIIASDKFSMPDEKIEFKENRMILFPGCIPHETEKITTKPNSYRISMAQFINYA